MNGKKAELMPTSIKSENDSLRHSLHRTRQNLSSRESPPSTSSTRGLDEQPEIRNKRRVRRRASEPINVPSPQRSPYTTSTSSEEGFLYKGKVQAWDDSMVTTSYHTRKSVSFSIETQHSYYLPLRTTLPATAMSPQTGHLRSLPSDELARRGPLLPRERLFAEEGPMERVYMERDKRELEETIKLVNGREDSVHKRPDTPMTTLLMKMTEL
jgi:hypothetical protein